MIFRNVEWTKMNFRNAAETLKPVILNSILVVALGLGIQGSVTAAYAEASMYEGGGDGDGDSGSWTSDDSSGGASTESGATDECGQSAEFSRC